MNNDLRWHRVKDDRSRDLREGGVLRVSVRGRAICLVNVQGTLHAVEDRCPHQGKSLEGGWCEDGYLVCPWHQMRFDPVTGRNRFGMTEPLGVIPIEIRNNGIFVALPANGFVFLGIRLW